MPDLFTKVRHGLGIKTIGQIIKEMELDPGKVYQRLKAIHKAARDEDRLKSLAESNTTTPLRLMKTILVEDGQIK